MSFTEFQKAELSEQSSKVQVDEESSSYTVSTEERPQNLEDVPYLLGTSMPDLVALDGVVLRQVSRQGEPIYHSNCGCAVALDPVSVYEIKGVPLNIAINDGHDTPPPWKLDHDDIDSFPGLFTLREQSDCYTRLCMTAMGCRAMRPLLIRTETFDDYYLPLIFDKPLKAGGGCIINNPHQMVAIADGYEFGSVIEDVSFVKNIERIFCCTTYSKVYEFPPRPQLMDRSYDSIHSKYDVKFDRCRNGNFCGASFCNPHAVNTIIDSKSRKTVGLIYKIFAVPQSMCYCMKKKPDTFVISFPEESTQVERTLLVSAVLFNELLLFENDRDY